MSGKTGLENEAQTSCPAGLLDTSLPTLSFLRGSHTGQKSPSDPHAPSWRGHSLRPAAGMHESRINRTSVNKSALPGTELWASGVGLSPFHQSDQLLLLPCGGSVRRPQFPTNFIGTQGEEYCSL